jgi:hypothetical protein
LSKHIRDSFNNDGNMKDSKSKLKAIRDKKDIPAIPGK